MLEIKNLFFSYAKEYFTLNDINLSLNDNESAIIYGNKNSGKTSLIRVILGLDKFQKGKVTLNNIDVRKINFKNDLSVGYIPKNPPFMNNKSVADNLKYIIKLRNNKKEMIDVKLNNALGHYSLFIIKDVKVDMLNYYDKIKLALARLFVRELDFLIIDDVFSGLNDNELDDVCELINELIKVNKCACLIFSEEKDLSKYFNFKSYKLDFGSLKEN